MDLFSVIVVIVVTQILFLGLIWKIFSEWHKTEHPLVEVISGVISGLDRVDNTLRDMDLDSQVELARRMILEELKQYGWKVTEHDYTNLDEDR